MFGIEREMSYISLFLCTYGKKIFEASLVNEIIAQAFPVAFVWALLRMSGAFENSLDDMEILEENNAQLGPGLAASYWFGFLSTALKGDIPRNMEEFEQRLQERMENTQTACNIRSFKKMLCLSVHLSVCLINKISKRNFQTKFQKVGAFCSTTVNRVFCVAVFFALKKIIILSSSY